jgi:hypothetical protein
MENASHSGSAPETSPHQAEPRQENSEPRTDHLRSITRLVIGGTEVGLVELLHHLELWEAEVERWKQKKETMLGENEISPEPALTMEEQERMADLARFAVIGWIFSLHDSARRRVHLAVRAQRLAARIAAPALRSLHMARLLPGYASLDRSFEQLVNRGRKEVNQWIATGKAEEEHSQLLAGAAFDKTIDTYIEYLTHNPEVKDLVQRQSTGLATEVVEEVRERTVSADTFLEGMARSLLRKIPRAHLPEPPPEVRSGAIPIQRTKRILDE